MQLVVVMAVRKAVSAATITFTATSMILFFITHYSLFVIHYSLARRAPRLVLIEVCSSVTATTSTGIDHEARSLSGHSEATAIHTLTLGQLDL